MLNDSLECCAVVAVGAMLECCGPTCGGCAVVLGACVKLCLVASGLLWMLFGSGLWHHWHVLFLHVDCFCFFAATRMLVCFLCSWACMV